MTGLTGVVPITDRKQFSRSYEVLMRLATQNFPPDDGSGSNARIHRIRFAGSDLHYANLGNRPGAGMVGGRAINWWSRWPRRTSRPICRGGKTAGRWPTCRRWPPSFRGRDPLLAIGYLDAPRLFESIYPLLILAGPSYLGASGLSEGRRDMSMIPSLPSVCRHLRPGVTTLRRTAAGLELTSRGSLPGFGLAAPTMFLAWDSEWLNLVFGEAENSAPPVPVGGGAAAPVLPAAVPAR